MNIETLTFADFKSKIGSQGLVDLSKNDTFFNMYASLVDAVKLANHPDITPQEINAIVNSYTVQIKYNDMGQITDIFFI